jgi:hypothetical protein
MDTEEQLLEAQLSTIAVEIIVAGEIVGSVISASKEGADPEHIGRWKEWALLQADQLDPIATGRIWDDVKDSP